MRSSSRGTSVSIPFKNPLISLIGLMGISSIRLRYVSICTFCPENYSHRLSNIFRNNDLKFWRNCYWTSCAPHRCKYGITISISIKFVKPHSRVAVPPSRWESPLRTVLASFLAHGSSLCKLLHQEPVVKWMAIKSYHSE